MGGVDVLTKTDKPPAPKSVTEISTFPSPSKSPTFILVGVVSANKSIFGKKSIILFSIVLLEKALCQIV